MELFKSNMLAAMERGKKKATAHDLMFGRMKQIKLSVHDKQVLKNHKFDKLR